MSKSQTLKAGTQTGSLLNHVMSGGEQPEPEVGMGATYFAWTDRYALTVVEIKGSVVVLREDRAIRTDKNGMSDDQSYRYESDPEGKEYRVKLKDGVWRRMGYVWVDSVGDYRWRMLPKGQGGSISFGARRAYHDYTF